MTDHTLRYESVNPAFCTLTGYSAEDLIGARADTVFGRAMPLIESASNEQIPESQEVTLNRKDGSTVQVELRMALESDAGARVMVMTDISYRLLAEREREKLLASERAARADAERSNHLKEEFLATL
jgi:PAS domain S-box-containing protein